MSTRSDPLKPVYALQGEDWPKVDRTLERMVQRVVAEGGSEPERFSAADTPVADILAACQMLSFGGVQGVIVTGADAWRAADADEVVAYLEDPNPSTVLAIVSTASLPQRLQQAVERAGSVLRWGPESAKPADRRRWLEAHFAGEVARLGGHVSPALARFVVERACGEATDAQKTALGALMLTHEAEKLVAYAGGAQIDRDTVLAMTPEHPEARVYHLADALVAGDAAQAYTVLGDLVSGDDRSEPVVIVIGLSRHYRALARAQALGPGATADQVSAATGMKGYPARKVADQARALPSGAAARAVARIARLELDLRVSAQRELGGPELVLETAARDLVGIARGAVV